MTNDNLRPRILRLSEVIQITGLSRSTIYQYMEDGKFPKPIKLGSHSVGWVDSEVYDWVNQRIAERNLTSISEAVC